jgi:hypothetical protein
MIDGISVFPVVGGTRNHVLHHQRTLTDEGKTQLCILAVRILNPLVVGTLNHNSVDECGNAVDAAITTLFLIVDL